ncbi:MAG: thiol:disulfide interchange protein DsbA/DsbL [Nitrosomonadales bacterium]|nr:thiol:disulfide interchange protein DsbA/DsbL [Nitrosomonadales bacterium]
MRFIKQFFAVVFLLCATQAFAEPIEGKDYILVKPAQPTHSGNKIEVIEFFFYGCSHCFKLNPSIEAWEKKMPKDVEFTYVPAVFNPVWEISARTYYALEALGQRKQVHNDLFNAWDGGLELVDEASTAEFLGKHGVDRNKFSAAYNSFSMQSQVTRAKQMGRAYGITGTPTLIVDGKYLITGLHPAEMMQALDAVIEKARKEHPGATTDKPARKHGATKKHEAAKK